MGFFREARNFTIEGDNVNTQPPNVPELLAEVAHIVHRATSDLPPGSHFRGTLQSMDGYTSSYLKAELSQKDALLQAMNERKARKAEAARTGGMRYPVIGSSEDCRVRDGGALATEPSRPPQTAFEFHPDFGTQQGVNPIMLPGPLPVDVPLQGVPFFPQEMNVPTRESPSYHPIWEPNGYPMNASYLHGFQSMQGVPGSYIPPVYLPSNVHHPVPPHPNKVVESDELEEAEPDEQPNSFRKRESRAA